MRNLRALKNIRALKNRIPWWGKILGHVLISKLPVSYKFWHRLGILQHGWMEDPSYAFGVFTKHFRRVQFAKCSGFVGLELGPGDSLVSAVIANAFGASSYYLVDSGDFAQKDANIYKNVAAFLEQQGLPAPKLDRITSWQEVLQICNATYETAGLASLKAIPTGSVDYIWGHGVLQSVRRAEFFETLLELRRILRDDGASSQLIDLTDLVALALNHLRFPESLWESGILANCGIYSNRYRYSEMMTMFQKAGFSVDVVDVKRWSQLPTPRSKLDPQFRGMADEELLVMGFVVVLRPAVAQGRRLNKPNYKEVGQSHEA
jgi:hypothetical protein